MLRVMIMNTLSFYMERKRNMSFCVNLISLVSIVV